MISLNELKRVYDERLKGNLAELEAIRKRVMLNEVLSIILFVVPFIMVIIKAISMDKGAPAKEITPYFVAMLISIALGVVLQYLGKNKKREYRERFKDEVVKTVIREINPRWHYDPNSSITEQEYSDAKLFHISHDEFNGDDLITGTIEDTSFKCSEVHSCYKQVLLTKNGRTQSRLVPIFDGLFFVANLNFSIQGETVIRPEIYKPTMSLPETESEPSSKGELVMLGNPEFNKLFTVYSTNQVETRDIISPSIMDALLKIVNKYHRPIFVSFIETKIYFAIHFGSNLFEPKVFRSGVKFKDIEFMYTLISVNETIVNELNLNNKKQDN